jgi:hypothetical protein
MRISRVPRLAAFAFGLGLLAAGAIAPATFAFGLPPDDLPDLTVSQAASSADGYDVGSYPGGPLNYWLTVKNPSIQVWDPELHRYYTGGAPASGVVVSDHLPAGSQVLSASGDSGFSCSQSSGVVTCSGGTLPNGGTAHITINTNAPTAYGNYTNTAIVDPNNTIAERNKTNNASSLTVGVYVIMN